MPIPKCIKLTGKVYIKYTDENFVPSIGDILLLINDDAISFHVIDDKTNNINGFIKSQVYDGLVWQNMDLAEFCDNRENKLIKKQRVFDSFLLCKEIMNMQQGVELYKKYRGHFTRYQYEATEYIRNKRYDKSKNK